MAVTPGTVSPTNDDSLTVCAISLLSGMLADVLHEGLGHGAVALMTGAQSGVLTIVAWSSAFDSKLVAAGGTLANLVAGILFRIALRSAKRASVQLRFFLLTSASFNLLAEIGNQQSVFESIHISRLTGSDRTAIRREMPSAANSAFCAPKEWQWLAWGARLAADLHVLQ